MQLKMPDQQMIDKIYSALGMEPPLLNSLVEVHIEIKQGRIAVSEHKFVVEKNKCRGT